MKSPLLREEDVLDLIARASVAHHEAIAGRPHISERVTDALVVSESQSVLMALVRNATARISQSGYATLVEKSRSVAPMQEPLIHRPDLPPALADKMCEWVSDALKTYIKSNYNVAPKALDKIVAEAEKSVRHEVPDAHPEDSAHKLIEKLAASGQLKASFLMRVLNQGQVDLFDLAFAELTGTELSRFRTLFYDSGARMVAMACRAVGIDRSVFPTVYNLSRQAHGRLAALTKTETDEADTIFVGFTRQSALQGLKAKTHH
jgi:uncharacterized protein (DUF2336 family)